jgi:RHS repeat-associated protein
MAAARLGDEIGHVSVWARLARVGLRLAAGVAETLIVAGTVALVAGVSVATMGCGALIACGLLAGFIGGATGWTAYRDRKIDEMTEGIGGLDITGTLGTMGAATVWINDKLAMRAVADFTVCSKHGQPNPNFIAEGTDSVFIETFPAARKGDKLMCAAQIASGSDNVLFGGNKTAYLNIADDREWWETALEIGVGLAMGRGSFLGKLGCLALGAVAGMAGDALGRGFRALIGHPVHPATGGKVLDGSQDTDFALPGDLPIVWRRFYSNHDHRQDTLHGPGWCTPYEVELHVVRPAPGDDRPPQLVYVNPQGRHIAMPMVEPGHALFNTAEGCIVGCTPGGHFEVGDLDHVHQQFGPAPQEPGTHVLKLLRVRDRFGHWTALRYDKQRRLAGLTDHLGRVLRLDYAGDARRLTAIHLLTGAPGEQIGQLASYRYDTAGVLAEVLDRSRQSTRRFAYTEQLMVRHEDAAGFVCHYAWEPQDQASGPLRQDGALDTAGQPLRDRRVLRHWTDDGEAYAIAYGGDADSGGWTTSEDQLGRQQRWTWDRWHNLTSYTNPLGERWQLQWNAQRELLACIRPDGTTTRFAYDANGLQNGVTDALGQHTRTLWDSRWFEPLAITGPDGATWRFEYDTLGLRTRETAPDGSHTEMAYDAHGHLLWLTDAKGGRKALQWDARGLPVRSTDCSGQSTHYAYDGFGNLQTVTDALGQTTRSTYDARGLLQALSLPDGSSQTFVHDAAGRLVEHRDALSRSTRYGYNARGQLLWRIDAEGRQIAAAHDAAHRLAALATENGASYQFGYDAADRLVEEQRLDGTRITLEHDACGQVVAVTHHPAAGDDVFDELEQQAAEGTLAEGARALHATAPRRSTLQRDALGRLVQKATPGAVLHYAYDAAGQLASATRARLQHGTEVPEHTTRFAYDSVGNLVAEHATDAATGRTHSLRHAHDPLGNRTRTELPHSSAGRRSLNYLYYGSGHLHQVNLGLGLGAGEQGDAETLRLIADLERDALHREVHRTQGNLQTRYALDPLGRRLSSWTRAQLTDQLDGARWLGEWSRQLEHLQAGGAASGLLKHYQYDRVGELREVRHSHKGRSSHRYDATGRIEHTLRTTPAGQSQHEQFAYDPAGNLLDRLAQSAGGADGQTGTRGYIRDNLVRVYEDKRYRYDGWGRLLEKRSGRHTVQRFAWDDEDQLVAVTTTRRHGTPEASTQTTRFAYDAIGRRIAKHDGFGRTEFVWEGMRLIEERRGSQVTSYVYEPGSYVPMARIDGQGQVLGAAASAPDEPATPQTTARIYHFHADPSGLPEELTDEQGTVRWRAAYRTWGNTQVESWEAVTVDGVQARAAPTTEPIAQNLRLQGQYLDRDTGLHYNTFRYYDPDVGRFISPDPIGLAGGYNLHGYSPNPISWIDPLGWASIGAVGEYDVHGEVRVGREIYRQSDYKHFQESNRQLYYKMKNDPVYRAQIEGKYPGTFEHVSPGKRGAFSGKPPPNLTWHHHERVGGLLQLVDRADHNSRHKDFHPTGQGGRGKWGGGSACR